MKVFSEMPYWTGCKLEAIRDDTSMTIEISEFDSLIDFVLKKTTLDKSCNPFKMPFEIEWIDD